MLPKFVDDVKDNEFYANASIFVVMALMCLLCLIGTWFLATVCNCYKYLKGLAAEDPAETALMLEKS
uniref:Small integral membrane protein 24 n=1 Tax=Steinernema glaseri TaxID=37863 RepID=A0A1I8AWW6_9BILA